MLLPFIALFGLFIVGKIVAAPSRREYEQWKQMYCDYNSLQSRINYCATFTELEVLYNEAIEFFSEYKFVNNIRDYCGRLHSSIENRRVALRNMRKIRA